MADVLNYTSEDMKFENLSKNHLVLVDFWAAWCGPCRMLAPAVTRLAEDHPEIKVCKVNIDEQPDLAAYFEVAAVPTLFLFRGGDAVKKTMGYMPYSELEAFVG